MADIRVKHIVDSNSFARSSQESFTFSCFNDDTMPYNFDDHDLFFDMDVSVPFPWEHVAIAHDLAACSYSSEIQEFEFSMSFPDTASTIAGALSPADDLFYKGKLLPLHLPPRLRMMEHLSARDTPQDEELDVSSVLLSCYCRKSDAVENQDSDLVTTSDECEPPTSKESLLSWSGGSRGLRLSPEGSWLDGRSLQDPYIFPNCYRDPAFQIIQDGAVRRAATHPSTWRRPSLRWKVLHPGSRKSLKPGIEDSYSCTGKERDQGELKRAISVFKFRASASFLKSLFAVGDVGKGAESKEQKYRHHVKVEPLQSLKNSLQNATSAAEAVDDPKDPPGLTNTSTAQSEKDRLTMSKARDYLRKYMKLLRSLYVMFSQKNDESEADLLGNARMNGTPASTFVSRANRDEHGQIHRFFSGNLRTTSFSKRSRDNNCISNDGSTDKNHSGNLRANSNHQGNIMTDSNPSRIEVENPIKGAIAHCKQSSEGGSWIRNTPPVHTTLPASL